MTDSDITTTILRQIRDQLEKTNEKLDAGFDRLDHRLDETNQRLDVTNERLDAGFERLDRRIDATNQRLDVTNERLARVETGVQEMGDELRDLNRYVRNTQAAAIPDLRERVTRLEKKVG